MTDLGSGFQVSVMSRPFLPLSSKNGMKPISNPVAQMMRSKSCCLPSVVLMPVALISLTGLKVTEVFGAINASRNPAPNGLLVGGPLS